VFVAFVALALQEKLSPLKIDAIKVLPKLSNAHKPGSVTTSPDGAEFQPANLEASVTVAPDE